MPNGRNREVRFTLSTSAGPSLIIVRQLVDPLLRAPSPHPRLCQGWLCARGQLSQSLFFGAGFGAAGVDGAGVAAGAASVGGAVFGAGVFGVVVFFGAPGGSRFSGS